MLKKLEVVFVFIMFALLFSGIHVLRRKNKEIQKTGYFTVCPQDVRRHYIRETCRAKNLSNFTSFSQLFVDHPHRLVYCLVPKAASRTMRTILGSSITGNESYIPHRDFTDLHGINQFNDLSASLQKMVIQKYKKLIVVRHPYDRLVSVFESKLQPSNRLMIESVLGKNVIPINRYLTQINGKKTHFDPAVGNLTFEEFIGILSSEYDNGFRNEHWNTMFELCDPCGVDYDMVLRLETLEKDYRILASYLGLAKRLRQSAPYLNKMRSSLFDPDEKLFNLLLRYEHLDSETLDGLRSVYQRDFDVFGYSWDDHEGANCRIPLSDSTYCC